MFKNVLWLGLLAYALSMSATAEARWIYDSDRDPFTDERASTAIQRNPGVFGAAFVVRCKDGILESYYVPGQYLGSSGTSYVRYRFDRLEPESGYWNLSTNGKAVFSDTAAEIARGIVRGSSMVIEAEDVSGSGQVAHFSLSGSSGPVSRVLSDCRLRARDPRVDDDQIWRRVVQSVDEMSVENAEFVGTVLDDIYEESAPHGDRRGIAIYKSMTELYLLVKWGCKNGSEQVADLPSCKTYLSRLERDPDAEYPVEAVPLLVEILEKD